MSNNTQITKEDVEKLATLSRIKLTDEEIVKFQGEISSILGYVSSVNTAVSDQNNKEGNKESADQTPSVKNAPSYESRNAFRDDVPERNGGEYTKDLINLAPYKDGNYVQVKHMF